MNTNEKQLKSFSVVYFALEHRYAVIPSSWLHIDRESCYWPGPKTKNPTKLIKDQSSQPDKTFKKFVVQYIKSYDSYEKAEQKSVSLKQSQSLHLDSSDYERDQPAAPIIEVPNRPVTPTSFLLPTDHELDFGQEFATTSSSQVFEIPKGNSRFETEAADHDLQYILSQSDPVVEQLRLEFQKFAEVSVVKQEEIIAELKDLKKLFRQVLGQQSVTQSSNQTPHNYPTLPLQSLEEITETERCIQDQEQFKFLVIYFD